MSRVEFGTAGVGETRVGTLDQGGILARKGFWLCPALIALAIAISPTAAAAAPGELGCDPLDPAVCLQPWPNDYFTVPDSTSDTGRRLNINPLAMPRNIAGNPIRPDEWNRNDGFSPGQKIVTKVPGLDTPAGLRQDRRGADHRHRAHLRPGPADRRASTRTRGERHLIWSELDANPANPADVNLIIRPAVNFDEGAPLHRRPAQPQGRERRRRSRHSSRSASTATGAARTTPPSRRAARTWRASSRTLRQAGHRAQRPLPRLGLHRRERAQPLRARALSIRDDAFAALGDTNLSDLQVQGTAPTFTVTQVDRLHARGGQPASRARSRAPSPFPAT